MFAQVNLAHFFVLYDVLRRAFRDHDASAQDISMVAYPERLAHVVLGDQDTDASISQVLDDLWISMMEIGSTPQTVRPRA